MTLKVPHAVVETRLRGLPEGVTVERRRLDEVRYDEAETAVERLFMLAQVLIADWPAFQSLVDGSPTEPVPIPRARAIEGSSRCWRTPLRVAAGSST